MSKLAWKVFPCCINELKIETTLACGQSFRWKELNPGEWTGVIHDKVWKFKQTPLHLLYQVYSRNRNTTQIHTSLSCDNKDLESLDITHIKTEPSIQINTKKRKQKQSKTQPNKKLDIKKFDVKIEPENDDNYEQIIRNYFQLDVNLVDLYKHWASVDSNFKDISQNFPGIRILRQDPVENLYSFICSSNNHISRISGMVEKLCVHFGEEICEVDGEKYYQFPTVESLSGTGVEQKLRELSFGYRAKYISQTSQYIMKNHNQEWLYTLRQLPYTDVKKQLMSLCGVGAKVADCVCLMSMDQTGSIPVDTHVWQITARHYIPKLQTSKSLTDKLYQQIGDHFRELWGDYAGWAHSVLFTADLKKFKVKKETKKGKPSKKIVNDNKIDSMKKKV